MPKKSPMRSRPNKHTYTHSNDVKTILDALTIYFQSPAGGKRDVTRSDVFADLVIRGLAATWRDIRDGVEDPERDRDLQYEPAVIEFVIKGMRQNPKFQPILVDIGAMTSQDVEAQRTRDAIQNHRPHPEDNVILLHEYDDVFAPA